MTATAPDKIDESWRRRLFIPCYKVGEAASYAHISPQTVGKWHRADDAREPLLSKREKRSELSYMQLIEIAVVAAFRKQGLPLNRIREAREYFGKKLKSEFPFAEYRFKSEGRELWADYDQIEGPKHADKLINANRNGQLAWKSIIGRLKEFEYEDGGVVVRWHVGGSDSPVVIDPRISFGAPTVDGTPTWVIKGRWEAGESVGDIANDFDLENKLVIDALIFEGIEPDLSRKDLCLN